MNANCQLHELLLVDCSIQLLVWCIEQYANENALMVSFIKSIHPFNLMRFICVSVCNFVLVYQLLAVTDCLVVQWTTMLNHVAVSRSEVNIRE